MEARINKELFSYILLLERPTVIRIVFLIFLVAVANLGYSARLAAGAAPIPAATIADELLVLEFGGKPEAVSAETLHYFVDSAVSRNTGLDRESNEKEKAQRFFRTVDQVLAELGIIYPPHGQVDLLRNALRPRHPSDSDFSRAEMSPYNMRKQTWIRAAKQSGEPFYYFDCDVVSVIYVSVAQRLALPVAMVELPGHNFLRWQSSSFTLNWDPNEGRSIDDATYIQRWRVTPDSRRLFGYLDAMSPERLRAYWLVVVSQWKCRKGDYAAGLHSLREAARIAPQDYAVKNELAWFLATCPIDALRSGTEAVRLAEELVKQAARASWLDTLAAAYSETGDFQRAIETELAAKAAASTQAGALAINEQVADFDDTLRIYKLKFSFAQGVRKAMLTAKLSPAALND